MADKAQTPFYMYFKTDKGIIHSDYHADKMEIVQVTQGRVECEIGTDKVFAGEDRKSVV